MPVCACVCACVCVRVRVCVCVLLVCAWAAGSEDASGIGCRARFALSFSGRIAMLSIASPGTMWRIAMLSIAGPGPPLRVLTRSLHRRLRSAESARRSAAPRLLLRSSSAASVGVLRRRAPRSVFATFALRWLRLIHVRGPIQRSASLHARHRHDRPAQRHSACDSAG